MCAHKMQPPTGLDAALSYPALLTLVHKPHQSAKRRHQKTVDVLMYNFFNSIATRQLYTSCVFCVSNCFVFGSFRFCDKQRKNNRVRFFGASKLPLAQSSPSYEAAKQFCLILFFFCFASPFDLMRCIVLLAVALLFL